MSKPKQEQKQTAPEVSGQREQERPALPTEITVRAYPVSDMGQVLANLSVDVNGCFAIRGAKLVQGKNGPFVSMPQKKVGEEYNHGCLYVDEDITGTPMKGHKECLRRKGLIPL